MKPLKILLTACMSGMLLATIPVLAQITSEAAMLKPPGVKTGKNLALSLASSPDHTTLLKLLKASGLDKQAVKPGPYTVFAPTDAAFSVLPERDLEELLLPSGKPKLIKLLTYLIVNGNYTSDQLSDAQSLINLTGQVLRIHKQGDDITVEDGRGNVAIVVQRDIRTTNGVVYSIDKVLQQIVD
ncbi:MAG: fasciclin domain-containing protein [Spirosoma sp.]|nr:fasciclin domain-containing protein [Spirosoma sp.]